jgi:2-desacetyl-2-hydroxyethyl bacteriochlorophyllide A dehydrogenase
MKTLVCSTPGKLEYKSRKKPIIKKDHAIIKIERIGICGTDLHAYEGNQPYFAYPRILGHELAGELIDCDNAPGFRTGEAVTIIPYFNCGTCIACRSGKPNCCVYLQVCGVHVDGGMAEYLSVPSYALVHGEGLSMEQLALVEPQSIGAHGVSRADIKKGEFVLVVGAGPIGMGAMESARQAGGQIIAMDVSSYRLSICTERLGVQYTVDASREEVEAKLRGITNGDMAGLVIDATGNQSAINNSFQYMAHGGRYILIGLQKKPVTFSHPEFHKREATVMSSRNAVRKDFEHVISSMKSGLVNPEAYLSVRTKFSRLKDEFQHWINSQGKVVKVVVEMD